MSRTIRPKKRSRPPNVLDPLIFTVRGERVVLDADLARLYGVATRQLIEAFRRNRRRFPAGFAFQLTAVEFIDVTSEIAASTLQSVPSDKERAARSAFATGRRGAAHRPWAFTEYGALMAATILRSERAAQMSIFVIRALLRLRAEIAANQAIFRRLADINTALSEEDHTLWALWHRLQPLLQEGLRSGAPASPKGTESHPMDRFPEEFLLQMTKRSLGV